MSPEAWISLGALVTVILCTIFGYVFSRIKELSAQLITAQDSIQALTNRVSLECVTYERLEKIMAQSFSNLESTMRRFEEDLKSLETVKETVIAIKTKMELKA